MPAFLVHGVADTHVLWDAVRAELSRDDVIAPDLPGFRSPVPDGFGATKEEYADWLIAEVEKVGEPVDLVGHDWGSLLVHRVVSLRPELIRTWVGGAGVVDHEYRWHDFARKWQEPDTGPEMVPTDDPVMAQCILALYRSAVDVFTEWWPDLERAPAKALIIMGADDPFVPAHHGVRVAERVGGESLVLEGCGHWWPVERPHEVADAIERLWASAGPTA